MGLNDLQGVIPALATPLTINEEVDEAALRRNVQRIVAAGASGVLVLGSAGEGVMLNEKERFHAVEIVVDAVAEKIPVITGTGDLNTKKVKENNRIVAGLGVKYALAVPPFYFHLRQEDITEYYLDIAAEDTIPILIYNIPQNTKLNVELKTIEVLSRIDNIVGIKDSSGNWDYLQQLVLNYQNERFKVFAGKANLLFNAFLIGAAGSITPVPNIDPKVEVELYTSILDNNLKTAIEKHKRVLAIAELFKNDVLPVSVNLNAALKIMGICNGITIKPLPQASNKVVEELRNKLMELMA